MTGFRVEPAELRKLAEQLGRADDDVRACARYLDCIQGLAPGHGDFDETKHEQTMATLEAWLNDVRTKGITRGAEAITHAAAHYEVTDRDAAAQLDASQVPSIDLREVIADLDYHPPASSDRGDYHTASVGRFEDVSEPQAALKPISKGDYELDMMSSISWYEHISTAVVTNELFVEVTGALAWLGLLDRAYNPLEEMFRPFVGDWSGVAATADVLQNLGVALKDVERNIGCAFRSTQQVWTGNAADGAAAYLLKLGKPIDDIRPMLYQLSAAYESTAADMVTQRDAIIGLYSMIVDAVVGIAAASAIGGGATTTAVGAPVGVVAGLYIAYKASRISQAISKIMNALSVLKTVTLALASVMADFDTNSASLVLPSLPEYR